MFRNYADASTDPVYSAVYELDLAKVVPSMSGPKRPHDRVPVSDMKADFGQCLQNPVGFKGFNIPSDKHNTGKIMVSACKNDHYFSGSYNVRGQRIHPTPWFCCYFCNYFLYKHFKSNSDAWCWFACQKCSWSWTLCRPLYQNIIISWIWCCNLLLGIIWCYSIFDKIRFVSYSAADIL